MNRCQCLFGYSGQHDNSRRLPNRAAGTRSAKCRTQVERDLGRNGTNLERNLERVFSQVTSEQYCATTNEVFPAKPRDSWGG